MIRKFTAAAEGKMTNTLVVGKTSSYDDTIFLPLTWHLRDTAGIMRYILKRWASEALINEIHIDDRNRREKLTRYAVFPAYAGVIPDDL